MSDPSTTVSAAPIVADALPYVQAIAATIITALSGVVVALLNKYLGIRADSATVAMVDSYIENLAASEVAKAADNLATAQIDVRSPMVKALVEEVATALPVELNKLGLSSIDIANKVTAAFGRLQAGKAVVAPAAVPAGKAS